MASVSVGAEPPAAATRIERRKQAWFPRYRPAHERYVEIIEAEFPPAGRVLDLGAGRDVLGRGSRIGLARVVAVDVDPSGLTRNPNPRRAVCDGTRLPFRAGAFDMVLCEYVFEHLEAPAQVLQECRRVLRPGGALVFHTQNRGATSRWVRRSVRAGFTYGSDGSRSTSTRRTPSTCSTG